MAIANEAELRTLRALLIRGIVDDGDAEEMVDLTLRAFDLVGLGFSRDYHWSGNHLIGGDLSRWTDVYPEVGQDDPCGAFLESSPAGTWYVAALQARHAETETYRAFVREEFADVAIARFDGPDGGVLPCALYRDRVRGRFDAEDIAQLQALYPLWAGALQTRSALESMSLSDEAGPSRSLGSVEVTYPDGAVHWNHRARSMFESEVGRLSPRGWTRIERALRRVVACFSGNGQRRQRLLGGLTVEVAHLPTQEGEARRVVVLFYRHVVPPLGSSAPRTPSEELISDRQRAIARLVVRGLTLPAIAARLDIAPETVRHHLRTVFERLDVRTRSQLGELID